jgi:hypothetical protein
MMHTMAVQGVSDAAMRRDRRIRLNSPDFTILGVLLMALDLPSSFTANRDEQFIGNSSLFHRLSADPSSDLNYPNENPG